MMEQEPYSVDITTDNPVEHVCAACGGYIYRFDENIFTASQGMTMDSKPVGPWAYERWYHIGCM